MVWPLGKKGLEVSSKLKTKLPPDSAVPLLDTYISKGSELASQSDIFTPTFISALLTTDKI
jgi:hypothetical protein